MATDTKTQLAGREWLERFSHDASNMIDTANAYMEAMRDTAVAAQIGRYYKTFNGSVVYISGRWKEDAEAPEIPDGMPDYLRSFLEQEIQKQQAASKFTWPKFTATILKGGHGCKGLIGKGPGESYPVNAAGEVYLPANIKDFGAVVLSGAHLAIVGLSLQGEVSAP